MFQISEATPFCWMNSFSCPFVIRLRCRSVKTIPAFRKIPRCLCHFPEGHVLTDVPQKSDGRFKNKVLKPQIKQSFRYVDINNIDM